MSAIDPARVIAELRELHALTGGPAGAQRLAWSSQVARARGWLDERLRELPVEISYDAAGNHWATLPGRRKASLVLGSHLDSVAGGGWLDGSLGVLAGLEVMRTLCDAWEGRPPITLRLVDWADEEGARFGRSLLGSSAAAGTLDLEEIRGRVDGDGVAIEAAMAASGVDLERLLDSGRELADIAAYLELHIEQGPVLERAGAPVAVVDGTCGAVRYRVRFVGEACHPAATPLDARRDALLAGARLIAGAHEIAERASALTSIGSCQVEPGHITIIAGACTIVIEQNHVDPAVLRAVEAETVGLAHELAAGAGLEVEVDDLWRIEPLDFDADLVARADAAVRSLQAKPFHMPSGPLHDAGEMVRAGIPSAMLFVQSRGGISHNPREDTDDEHLELAVRALGALAEDVLGALATR